MLYFINQIQFYVIGFNNILFLKELDDTIIEEQTKNVLKRNENIEDENNFDKDYEPSEDSTSYTNYESDDEIINNENEANTCNISLNKSIFNLSTTANASGVMMHNLQLIILVVA